MNIWVTWGIILILQNFSFTFVSRARNSGSLRRHVFAALCSNGVWFISQTIIFTEMYKIMTGQYGTQKAVLTALFYTSFTVLGSIAAHYVSLRTEKGKSSVGASAKYAQIKNEDWADLQTVIKNLVQGQERLLGISEQLVKDRDAINEVLNHPAMDYLKPVVVNNYSESIPVKDLCEYGGAHSASECKCDPHQLAEPFIDGAENPMAKEEASVNA